MKVASISTISHVGIMELVKGRRHLLTSLAPFLPIRSTTSPCQRSWIISTAASPSMLWSQSAVLRMLISDGSQVTLADSRLAASPLLPQGL